MDEMNEIEEDEAGEMLLDELTRKLEIAREALNKVDALDPERSISAISRPALEGMVLMMGQASRTALKELED